MFRDPRFLLVKDSTVTALLGLACLGSLFTSRPLMFVLARQFAGAAGTDASADLETRWQSASFRAAMRRITAIWGAAFIAEASIRVDLSFVLTPAALLTVSPLLALAVFGPLGLWTFRRRNAASRQAAQSF